MKELGIDISGHRSKHVDEFQDQSFDYVLRVCDNAKESCLCFPVSQNAFTRRLKTRQPSKARKKEEERLALFRRVRNEIRDYLKTFPS